MEKIKTEGIILTGRYEAASPEEISMIQAFFGEKAEHRFKLYFYWYNVIHELGHAIINQSHDAVQNSICPAEEEQLANDFAVAYWTNYGETQKRAELAELISFVLTQIPNPAQESIDYMEYAKTHWNSESLSTFCGYGWFQFHSVQHSMEKAKPPEEVLLNMGVSAPSPAPHCVMQYDLEEQEVSGKILRDASGILRDRNVPIPNISHQMTDSPFCHCFMLNNRT